MSAYYQNPYINPSQHHYKLQATLKTGAHTSDSHGRVEWDHGKGARPGSQMEGFESSIFRGRAARLTVLWPDDRGHDSPPIFKSSKYINACI